MPNLPTHLPAHPSQQANLITPNAANKPKIAIVGAGWAGLACAVELTRAGIPVEVFEAGKVAGGRARSLQLGGFGELGDLAVDNGQHLLLGAYRDTLDLLDIVGVDAEQVFLRQPLHVQDGKGFRLSLPQLPPPLHVAWGLLHAQGQGLTLKHKLQTAWAMLQLQRRGFRLPPNAPQNITVATWLAQTQPGNPLNESLWRPLCLAAMNTPAERAAAQVFFHVLRDSLGSWQQGATDMLLPKVPLGDVFPEAAVRYLRQHGSQVHLQQRVKTLASLQTRFAAVVVATAPYHAQKLLETIAETTVEKNSAIANFVTRFPSNYEPIATIYLQYPAECTLPTPLFHLHGKVGQWLVDHHYLGKPGLIACVQSGQGDWCNYSEAELIAAIDQELRQQAFAQNWLTPLWAKRITEQRATFSCTPDHYASISLQRKQAFTITRNLYLCGDYTWADYPATLEGAVRSGRLVARLLQQ